MSPLTSTAVTIPAVPATPSDFQAVPVHDDEANLTWIDNAVGEDGFTLTYVAQGSGDSPTTITVPPHGAGGSTGYTLTGLRPEAQYDITLEAFNAAGPSASVAASFTTLSPAADGGVVVGEVTPPNNESTIIDFNNGSDEPPGRYAVAWVGGAADYNEVDAGNWWGATWPANPTDQYFVDNDAQKIPIGGPGAYPTEAQAVDALEATPPAVSFQHTSGPIGVNLYDDKLYDNGTNGGATWELFKMPDLPVISIAGVSDPGVLTQPGANGVTEAFSISRAMPANNYTGATTVNLNPFLGTAIEGVGKDYTLSEQPSGYVGTTQPAPTPPQPQPLTGNTVTIPANYSGVTVMVQLLPTANLNPTATIWGLLQADPSYWLSDSIAGPATAGIVPTIVDAAAANPNPVTGTTTQLSVLAREGADDSGLTYTWTTVGTPPAPVTVSDNGDNSAKMTTATFTSAGDYTFLVTAADRNNLSTTSQIEVDVAATATSISITPGTPVVEVSTATEASTQQFGGEVSDQFGNVVANAGPFVWSDSSGSPIDTHGFYTAPTFGNTDTVSCTYDGLIGQAVIGLIGSANPTVIAVGANQSEIDLSWTSVPNAICYNVYRSTSSAFSADETNLIAQGLSASSLQDFQLTGSATYFYEVFAEIASPNGPTELQVGGATGDPGPVPEGVPTLTGLLAVGVNRLEILLQWQPNPDARAFPTTIQESSDGTNWFDVGFANAGADCCLVRGCGPGGSQFLQPETSYTFRVRGSSGEYSNTEQASVADDVPSTCPNGNDMVVVCAPLSWTLSRLLAGITINPNSSGGGPILTGQSAANSMGMIWASLVDKGFNAYLTPDPIDGGSFSSTGDTNSYYVFPDGEQLESTINTDGSGRLADEIELESEAAGLTNPLFGITSGLDLSFVGYSYGGGVVAKLAQYLIAAGGAASVPNNVYVATIDAVAYPTSGATLLASPALYWKFTTTNCAGSNYYEANLKTSFWTGKQMLPIGAFMPGVNNYLYANDDHVTIGLDYSVLLKTLSDLTGWYGGLSS